MCARGRERPPSPRDSVSHKLRHKAALLSLAWVRPLLSSSNMPATCSHDHAHTSVSVHATFTHTHNSAHMAREEFICRFLVIATKTPNLDASRSFPKTPEWRANFKQPLALLSFFLRPPFLILSFRGEKKGQFCYLLKRGKILYVQIPHVDRRYPPRPPCGDRATRRDSRERTSKSGPFFLNNFSARVTKVATGTR